MGGIQDQFYHWDLWFHWAQYKNLVKKVKLH